MEAKVVKIKMVILKRRNQMDTRAMTLTKVGFGPIIFRHTEIKTISTLTCICNVM